MCTKVLSVEYGSMKNRDKNAKTHTTIPNFLQSYAEKLSLSKKFPLFFPFQVNI